VTARRAKPAIAPAMSARARTGRTEAPSPVATLASNACTAACPQKKASARFRGDFRAGKGERSSGDRERCVYLWEGPLKALRSCLASVKLSASGDA
jgi:hypothetical protein